MISSHEVAEAITILGKIPISAYPGKSYDERSHNAVTVVDTLIEMSKTLPTLDMSRILQRCGSARKRT